MKHKGIKMSHGPKAPTIRAAWRGKSLIDGGPVRVITASPVDDAFGGPWEPGDATAVYDEINALLPHMRLLRRVAEAREKLEAK